MKRMDDLIQVATYRLGPDAELQAEIARELRAHLEDAEAAARAGGMDKAQAEEAAIRAFGDPQEVAEKLWQANRRRMRLRAIAKWTGRLVLMPAGILLSLWLCVSLADQVGAVVTWGPVFASLGGLGGDGGSIESWLRSRYAAPLAAKKDLSQDERLVIEAEDSLVKWQIRTAFSDVFQTLEETNAPTAKLEELVRRSPDNPMYRAKQYSLFRDQVTYISDPLVQQSPGTLDRGLAILDAGEKIDPNNAFWNYMKADLLMYVSGAARQEEDPSFTYPLAARGDGPTTGHGERLLFTDRGMFERGLAEYWKGQAKPFFSSYEAEFVEVSLALRKRPATLLDELRIIEESASMMIPFWGIMRNMSRGIMAYAALLIQEGHPQEAEALIRTAPVPGTQIGARSKFLIELLVAKNMRQTTLRQCATLYERMGKRGLAAEAGTAARTESQCDRNLKVDPNGEEKKFINERSGILGRMLFAAMPNTDRSIITDFQRAERFTAERAALGVLALLYLVAAGWMGIWTLWNLWRHRKDTRGPLLYFIGWRRLGLIALIAVALPLAAYVIFTRAFAFGSAHYGMNYQPVRVALEMGGAVLLTFGLPLFLGWRAARKRCREAGIADRKEFRMSVRRSMLPVLVSCFLLVGIVSQAYLRYGEAAAVRSLSQPGRRIGLDEVEYTTAKDYRAYLRALPDHGALQADTIRR